MAEKKQKGTSCGSCDYVVRSPKTLGANSKALNIKIGFEEALKLKISVDECVLRLNKLNRATRAGKRAALGLIVYLDKKRLQVVKRTS